MSCFVEENKDYDVLDNYQNNKAPVFAGTLRILLGLTFAFAGLYIATMTDIQGHGLGLLIFLGSPFVILTDDK